MSLGTLKGKRQRKGRAAVIGLAAFVFLIQCWLSAAFFVFLGLILILGLSGSSAGIVREIGADGQPLYASTDLLGVPQSVSDDAERLAADLFGKHGEKAERFVDELLASYVRTQDKDVAILFNPGGWGSGPMDMERPWGSILGGMQSLLSESQIDCEVLTYQRSASGFRACCEELTEVFRGYSSKARILALRVRFLTEHDPDLRVVIVGESTGAQIGGKAMDILSEDPRVFCIHIGPPFWYRQDGDGDERTLVIADNGMAPDSFSRGDAFTIINANLAALVGKSQPNDSRGTILKYLRAPGHDYWWDYPAVASQITRFFEDNVGIRKAD